MRENIPETAPPPEEFPAPGAEYTYPEEFPVVPTQERDVPRKGKKSRLWKLAAAAILTGAVVFAAGRNAARIPLPAAVPLPVETASPAATAAPTAKPTPAPTAVPTAEPTPTPTPEPEKTEVEAVFISFSDTLEGRIYFRGQQNILKAFALAWDEQIQREVASFEISHEAIERGVFDLPTLETGEIYYANREEYDRVNAFPDPELQVICLVRNKAGEEEDLTVTVPNSYELGFSTRYYGPDTEEDSFRIPDAFIFHTYESTVPFGVALSDADPTRPGDITVSVTVNGAAVPPDMAEAFVYDEAFELFGEKGPDYYYGCVRVRRSPAWPEHGTVHFTVREALRGYDTVWVTERDVEY